MHYNMTLGQYDTETPANIEGCLDMVVVNAWLKETK